LKFKVEPTPEQAIIGQSVRMQRRIEWIAGNCWAIFSVFGEKQFD
jgi:hypothetical protein